MRLSATNEKTAGENGLSPAVLKPPCVLRSARRMTRTAEEKGVSSAVRPTALNTGVSAVSAAALGGAEMVVGSRVDPFVHTEEVEAFF